MSFSAFKDVRNMKKNSITATMLNLDRENKIPRTEKRASGKQEFIVGENKIKDFDSKLEQHKTQIEKNNNIISELSDGLMMVKQQLLKQTEKSEQEEKKCKQLKDQIERSNRLFKNKSYKLDEATRRLQLLEKQLSQAKPAIQKNAQLNTKVASLSKKVAQLEKSLADQQTEKRNIINDKDYQIVQLKNTLSLLQTRYGQSQQLKNTVSKKQQQLSSLKNQHSSLVIHLQKQRRASVELLNNNAELQSKLAELIDETKSKEALITELTASKSQLQQMRKKLSQFEQTKSHLQKTEQFLRKKNLQYEELSMKYSISYDENMAEIRKLQDDISDKGNKIRYLTQQIEAHKQKQYQMSNELQQSSKATKQLVAIKDRSSKLQVLYKQLLPPLKCSMCTKDFDKPVTIIPCGHNYCLGCKKGYNKTCVTCGPQLKIQAVYRNELLDDIVKVVKDIKQLLTLIN